MLWNDLTAQEHMELFAGMKGVPRNKQKKEIRDLLERVQLNRVSNSHQSGSLGLLLDIFYIHTCMYTHTHTHTQVANHRVRTFSGGMKRRLSVALSFLGDPFIVFLGRSHTVNTS